jgi:hypothetical protein
MQTSFNFLKLLAKPFNELIVETTSNLQDILLVPIFDTNETFSNTFRSYFRVSLLSQSED